MLEVRCAEVKKSLLGTWGGDGVEAVLCRTGRGSSALKGGGVGGEGCDAMAE